MRGLKKVGKKSRRATGSSVSLDRVIGITSRGNSGISLNLSTNELAYIASGVVVFYNVQSNQSSNYDPDTGGQYVTNTSVITNTRTITTSDSSIRTGIDVLKSSNKTITRDIGSKIVDTSVIPYVRSRIVDFAAVHMKPNSVIYVTLDGADVSMYCTMGTRLVISGLTTNISLNQMTKVRNVTTVGNVTITKLATVLLGTDNKVFVKVDGSSNGIFEV